MVFLSLGFAHRTPVFATDTRSVAYSLPDGSYADLCVAGQGQKHAGPALDCEACRLAGAVLLPTPSDSVWLLRRFERLEQIVSVSSKDRSRYLLDRPRLRGPPLLV
jgi:hypothetical protein